MRVLRAIFIICFLIMLSQVTFALPDSLGLKEENGKTYIMHRVDRGETLFHIGQRYDVAVKQLKATNPQADENLVVGEVILVPYKQGTQSKSRQSTQSKSWKKHTVKKGETLFSISQQYKTSVKQIKKWNNLQSNNIAVGQQLKVGKKEMEQESQQPEGDTNHQPAKPADSPANSEKQAKAGEQKQQSEKDTSEYAKAYSQKAAKTTTTPKGNGLVTKKQEGKATWLQNANISTQKSLALHRSAPAGTIIKVKNLMNDKVVYVRTVGKLNKQGDKNTLITISKKAAKELGVSGDYFRARLQYTIKEPSN